MTAFRPTAVLLLVLGTAGVLLSAAGSTVAGGEVPPRLLNSTEEAVPAADARAVETLERWEQAASVLMPVTEAERARLRVQHGQCSGHALSVLCRFRGPVAIEKLQQDFTWSFAGRSRGSLLLQAIPRDSTEQLFISSVQVTIDKETMLPASLKFTSSRGVSAGGQVAVFDAAARQTLKALHYAGPLLIDPQSDAELVRLAAAGETEAEAASGREIQLSELLARREEADRRQTKQSVKVERRTWDHVFHVVERERGELWFRQPDQGRLVLSPVDPQNRQTAAAGGTATLPAGWRERQAEPEEWIWNESTVLNRTGAGNRWLAAQRPAAEAPAAELRLVSAHTPWLVSHSSPQQVLPLVTGVRVAELERDYRLKIIRVRGRLVWISARPRQQETAPAIEEYQAVMDLDRLQTVALRAIHHGGGTETVWRFHDWKNGDDAWPDAALHPEVRQQNPAGSSRPE